MRAGVAEGTAVLWSAQLRRPYTTLRLPSIAAERLAPYLGAVALAEGVSVPPADLLTLANLVHGDVRRGLLTLQTWLQGAARLVGRVRRPPS